MYTNIKDIMKASVCSFCENIYEYESINENEFIDFLEDFLFAEDIEECLETCLSDIAYDYVNIENICDNNLRFLKDEHMDINYIIDNCTNAYLKTIDKDRTINVEAFVDNLARRFSATLN